MSESMVLGARKSGRGRVLMLVHGFPLDSGMWSAQLADLANLRRVVAVDLRGRGASRKAPDADWTLDTHADDIARTIERFGVEQVDVAGLSMGGYVLFALWRRHGEKLRSLILIDTKAAADAPEAQRARLETATLAREKGSAALVPIMLPRLVGPKASAAVKSQIAGMIESTPPETVARDALAMRERSDSSSDLSSITVPTLVLHGQDDALISTDDARAMARHIAGSTFVPIPDAGHMAPMENPAAVNSVMRAFLAQLDRNAP